MIYTKDNPKLVEDVYDFKGVYTFTGVVKDERNTIIYYLNGKYHRTDGPAVEYPNDSKWWCLNGKLHREDGPAVEYDADGRKDWYLNGEYYGSDNDYTNESWNRFVKLELLR